MIRKLYIKFGIIPEDEQIGGLVLTNLAATEYPILSDLMEIIREEKALHDATDEAYAYICKIELVIENLITNYGYIFNGHTSIEDIPESVKPINSKIPKCRLQAGKQSRKPHPHCT